MSILSNDEIAWTLGNHNYLSLSIVSVKSLLQFQDILLLGLGKATFSLSGGPPEFRQLFP
jgi:hypothetical protein